MLKFQPGDILKNVWNKKFESHSQFPLTTHKFDMTFFTSRDKLYEKDIALTERVFLTRVKNDLFRFLYFISYG